MHNCYRRQNGITHQNNNVEVLYRNDLILHFIRQCEEIICFHHQNMIAAVPSQIANVQDNDIIIDQWTKSWKRIRITTEQLL